MLFLTSVFSSFLLEKLYVQRWFEYILNSQISKKDLKIFFEDLSKNFKNPQKRIFSTIFYLNTTYLIRKIVSKIPTFYLFLQNSKLVWIKNWKKDDFLKIFIKKIEKKFFYQKIWSKKHKKSWFLRVLKLPP